MGDGKRKYIVEAYLWCWEDGNYRKIDCGTHGVYAHDEYEAQEIVKKFIGKPINPNKAHDDGRAHWKFKVKAV